MAAAADDEYVTEGLAAGFTRAQIKWLDDWYADSDHTHEIADVNGLEEELGGDSGEDDTDAETE